MLEFVQAASTSAGGTAFTFLGNPPLDIAAAAGFAVFGQLLRGLVGRMKAKQENAAAGQAQDLGFGRFVGSLLMAALAGALMQLFILDPFGPGGPFGVDAKDKIIALIGVGAAGVDFIESFLGMATGRAQKRVEALRS